MTQAEISRDYRRALIGGAVTGLTIALSIGGYVAWSVEARGCNPFLDHSDIGTPICGASP